MMIFYHEMLQRGARGLETLGAARVVVCGAGALGANVAETLARAGVGRITLVDRDRIEERNLSTQPYHRSDVGALKAKVLAGSLIRAVGTDAVPAAVELTALNAGKLLQDADLVIETFDNSASRRIVSELCAERGIACLHAGLADGYAEIIWNEEYRVPSAANDDVCDYPLARTLAMLAATVTSEVAIRFLLDDARQSHTITLGDLAIRPFGASSSGGPGEDDDTDNRKRGAY